MLAFVLWVATGAVDLRAVVDGHAEARVGSFSIPASDSSSGTSTSTGVQETTTKELLLRLGLAPELRTATSSLKLSYQPQLQVVWRELPPPSGSTAKRQALRTTLAQQQGSLEGKAQLSSTLDVTLAGTAFYGQLDALRSLPGTDPSNPDNTASSTYVSQVLDYYTFGAAGGGRLLLSSRLAFVAGATASRRGSAGSNATDLPTEVNLSGYGRFDYAVTERAHGALELSLARVTYSGGATKDGAGSAVAFDTRYRTGTGTAIWTWSSSHNTELELRGGAFVAHTDRSQVGSPGWLAFPVGEARFTGKLLRARRAELEGSLHAGESAYYNALDSTLGPRAATGGSLQVKAESGLQVGLSGDWLHSFDPRGNAAAAVATNLGRDLVVASLSASWLVAGTTRFELGSSILIRPDQNPRLQQFLLTMAISSLADLGV